MTLAQSEHSNRDEKSERRGGVPARSKRDERRRSPKTPARTFRCEPHAGCRSTTQTTARRMLLTLCVVSYSALIGLTALHWEHFVDTLVRAPSPAGNQTTPAVTTAIQSRGERVIAEAVRFMENDQPDSALALLDAIPQADPAYPFSRYLRRRLTAPRDEP